MIARFDGSPARTRGLAVRGKAPEPTVYVNYTPANWAANIPEFVNRPDWARMNG